MKTGNHGAEYHDTIIIGGGQAGLATSYYLKQQGWQHIILEQANQSASAWRQRWDSFSLNTPNWMLQLPGAVYSGDDPDAFMNREEIVSYLDQYIDLFELPIKYGHQVLSVEPTQAGYHLITNQAEFRAANVVVAAGLFQQPKIPSFCTEISSRVIQLHSSEYRHPSQLPDGAVMVIGSAQSGCQIAEELYQSGRKVFLSVGNSGRLPRRYRERDVTAWFVDIGRTEQTVNQLPSPQAKFKSNPHITGNNGGHTINLHKFAQDGVVLLGHIKSAKGEKVTLLPDLKESLAKVDEYEREFIKQVDAHIEKFNLNAPVEILPDLQNGFQNELILELDLLSAEIGCVIWATGYSYNFNFVKLPVFDSDGFPIQERGVTESPGLYFVGLPFLHKFKSGLLFGVGEDAAHITAEIMKK